VTKIGSFGPKAYKPLQALGGTYSSCSQPSTSQTVIKTWQGTSEPASASAIREHQAYTSISWVATVIGKEGCCDPPVCEHECTHCQPDCVIHLSLFETNSNSIYLLSLCSARSLKADSLSYAFIEPQIPAHRWPGRVLFAFRTTSVIFTKYRANVLARA